ncbi:elongation factor EF-1 alpha subunit, partial [Aureobasidium melanogenum]
MGRRKGEDKAAFVALLGPVYAVHLVDGYDDALYAHTADELGVLSCLTLETSFETVGTGVDDKNSKVCLTCSGNHVGDKVSVSRSIQDGELCLFRFEVVGGNVNGDTSFSLFRGRVHDPCQCKGRFANTRCFFTIFVERALVYNLKQGVGSATSDGVGSGVAGLRSSTGGGGEGLLRLRIGKSELTLCQGAFCSASFFFLAAARAASLDGLPVPPNKRSEVGGIRMRSGQWAGRHCSKPSQSVLACVPGENAAMAPSESRVWQGSPTRVYAVLAGEHSGLEDMSLESCKVEGMTYSSSSSVALMTTMMRANKLQQTSATRH